MSHIVNYDYRWKVASDNDEQERLERLIKAGGKEWNKGPGRNRVYLPVELCAKLAGLKASYYGSGNVSSATLDGERISNTTAKEMLVGYKMANPYYDVDAKRVRWQGNIVNGRKITEAVKDILDGTYHL